MDLEKTRKGTTKMRFSVIAPNFNEMPYIQNMFLESLVNQTFKDFEVIIVDGGSDDGSREIIEVYRSFLDITLMTRTRRNIGFIRNVGGFSSQGELMVQTSSDIALPKNCLERLDKEFRRRNLVAIGGRTNPTGKGNGILCMLAYTAFDTLRWVFTNPFMPNRWRKFRPAGNFLCMSTTLFMELEGYPEVKINEDGLFGYKLDSYVREHDLKAEFRLDYSVNHNVKRFEEKGALGAIKFYIYVVALMFPWLSRWTKKIEEASAMEFSDK